MIRRLYKATFPFWMRRKFANSKRQFEKLAELWKVTPSDCRAQLLTEFILFPKDFERRFSEEMRFQFNTLSRWQ